VSGDLLDVKPLDRLVRADSSRVIIVLQPHADQLRLATPKPKATLPTHASVLLLLRPSNRQRSRLRRMLETDCRQQGDQRDELRIAAGEKNLVQRCTIQARLASSGCVSARSDEVFQ